MNCFSDDKEVAMRMRSVVAVVPVLATAMLLAVPQADASTARVPARPVITSTGPASSAIHPASRVLYDVLSGLSCTTQPDNPSITSSCLAVGIRTDGPYIAGLEEFSDSSTWYSNIVGGIGNATEPVEVSCVPQLSDIPTCVAVGEHFNNPKYAEQLVEIGDANGFSPVFYRNPRGSTWSVLDAVSCVTASFCMMVGEAGTTRRTSHGLKYISHATAYRWDGGAAHRLKVPAPANARTTELAGVSCPAATSCLAVGNYTSSSGRFLPYSAQWTSGTWTIRAAKTIHGKRETVFQDVSCAAAGSCVAVGDAIEQGSAAFAEQYSGTTWTKMPVTAGSASGFNSVSCPTSMYCVAVGVRGTRSLIQAWSGSSWASQTVPATAAPFTRDELLHVSCVSPTICTAVGYRHNPAVRFSYRTLALGWDGASWTIQTTINE
jgi:hypothetical protein